MSVRHAGRRSCLVTQAGAKASLRGGGTDNGKQASSVVFCFGAFFAQLKSDESGRSELVICLA